MKNLVLLLATLVGPAALAADTPALKQVEELVAETQKVKPACDASKKAIDDLLPKPDGALLSKKADAFKLLTAVRTLPDKPSAYSKALDIVQGAIDSNGQVSDDLAKASMGLVSCDIVNMHRAFQALIQSAGPLKFSAQERAAVARVLLERIDRNLESYATIIEVLIYGSLLSSAIDHKVLDVSDAIFVETMRWNEQAELAKGKLREANLTHHWTIGLELRLTGMLRHNLHRLAGRLAQK